MTDRFRPVQGGCDREGALSSNQRKVMSKLRVSFALWKRVPGPRATHVFVRKRA